MDIGLNCIVEARKRWTYDVHDIAVYMYGWCDAAGSAVGSSAQRRLGHTVDGLHAWTRVPAEPTLRLFTGRRYEQPVGSNRSAGDDDRQTATGRCCRAGTALPGKTHCHSTYAGVLWTSQGGAQLSSVRHLQHRTPVCPGARAVISVCSVFVCPFILVSGVSYKGKWLVFTGLNWTIERN